MENLLSPGLLFYSSWFIELYFNSTSPLLLFAQLLCWFIVGLFSVWIQFCPRLFLARVFLWLCPEGKIPCTNKD